MTAKLLFRLLLQVTEQKDPHAVRKNQHTQPDSGKFRATQHTVVKQKFDRTIICGTFSLCMPLYCAWNI